MDQNRYDNVLRVTKASRQNTQGTAPVKPTLFIGLGGTGLKVLARFRRRLYERFGNPEGPPTFRFLAIDTNANDLKSGGGEGIPLRLADQKTIGANNHALQALLDGLLPGGRYDYIGKWMPNDLETFKKWDFTKGASQYRSLGRMMFCFHVKDLESAIQTRLQKILESSQDRDMDVVIISSIAGGTGAGSFLDCAYLVRHVGHLNGFQIAQIRGMLVLPDAFEKRVKNATEIPRIYANGYAALSELEYFSSPDARPFDISVWGYSGEPIVRSPFDVCYLMSLSNGHPLPSDDQLYDLLADAISFSTTDSALARRISGAWSNAQANVYEGKLVMEIKDDVDGGQPLPQKFARSWSSHFSSLGLARVTFKLPELRRLAGVRLLRMLADQEVGTPPRQESRRALTQMEAVTKPLLSRERFLLALPERVGLAVAAVASPGGDNPIATGENATALLGTTLGHLDQIRRTVQTARDSDEVLTDQWPRQLVVSMREEAADAAKTAWRAITSAANGLSAVADLADRVLAELQKAVRDLQNPPPDLDKVKDPDGCLAIAQWRNLDSHGLSDLLGLGYRAQKIVRRKTTEWFEGQSKLRLQLLDHELRLQFVQAIHRDLNQQNQQVKSDLAILRALLDQLRTLQDDLAAQFAETHNIVLTRDLAAKADSDKQRQLDRLIDEALRARADLSDPRKFILAKLGERAGYEVSSLLMVKRKLDREYDWAISAMVDAAADQLQHLLEGWDVFEVLNANDNGAKLLSEVITKAEPYWEIHPGLIEHQQKMIQPTRLAGAVVEKEPNKFKDMAVAQLTSDDDRRFDWVPGDRAARDIPRGEFIVVHEAHGYAIPSLNMLTKMRNHYEVHLHSGDAHHRHLDWRLRNSLPALQMVSNSAALAEVESWETALLAIILNFLRWNNSFQTYQYCHDGVQWTDVGETFEDVGRWLTSADGQQHRAAIDGHIMEWFKDRVDAPHQRPTDQEKRDEAWRQAKQVKALDLVLELLQRHCFPREVNYGGSPRRGPAHTLTKRIQRTRVREALHDLEDLIGPDQDAKLRTDLIPHLHKVLRFVGPAAPARTAHNESVMRAARTRRIVQFNRDPIEERAVLKEAIELGWFGDRFRVPNRLQNLFPDDNAVRRDSAADVTDVLDRLSAASAALESTNTTASANGGPPAGFVEREPPPAPLRVSIPGAGAPDYLKPATDLVNEASGNNAPLT